MSSNLLIGTTQSVGMHRPSHHSCYLNASQIIYTIITIFYHRFLIQDPRTMSTFELVRFVPSYSKTEALSSAVTEIWALD